ncbi:MAG: dynamin family protein [Gemmatimonadetes bacterium]|nr:dynamin family protein [Gemmatimonadota bacterium]
MEFAANRPGIPAADDSCQILPPQESLVPAKSTSELNQLHRLAHLARNAGYPEIAAEAEELAHRTAAGRFFVACVGEFKRGKTTLINALLGTSILPTGVPPVTAVPTIVRYGEPAARVYRPGAWSAINPSDIASYVTQERNPDNTRGIAGIEVYLLHPLLRDGLCLVDTPGLGSVFEANTATTREFLPHVDAAIVLLGADPPISADELRFAEDLAKHVGTLLFVMNKADRTPDAERAEAAAFTERVLAKALGHPVELFQVSATAMERGPAGPTGWRELVAALERLPATSGRELAHAAAQRGTERLARRLVALLEEEHRALLAPLEQSDRHLAALSELAAGATGARRTLKPLLVVEEQELVREFERRRVEFLEQKIPAARQELDRRWDVKLTRAGGLSLAHEMAREYLIAWLEASEPEAEAAYRRAVAHFTTQTQAFLQRAAAAADLPPDTVQVDENAWSGFQAPGGFYFTSLLSYHVSPLPWAGLADRLLPGPIARPRRRAAAQRYLEHLLMVNAVRVESDLREHVTESRVRLQREVDQVLAEVSRSAVRAAERGRAIRAAGDVAVRETAARLERFLKELDTLGGPRP